MQTIQNAKLRCNCVHEKFKNADEKFLEDFLMKMWLTCEINEAILKKDEKLYKKYELTEDEIAFIESTIRMME